MKKKVKLALSWCVTILSGIMIGTLTEKRIHEKEAEIWRRLSDKHLNLFLMMNQWTRVKQEGKNIASYLLKNGYRNIAIYGMSYAGETLLNELKGTEIQVSYGIDRNAEEIYADVDIVTTEDSLGQVDTVVVTAVSDFKEIKKTLQTKMACPIISLEDILYDI